MSTFAEVFYKLTLGAALIRWGLALLLDRSPLHTAREQSVRTLPIWWIRKEVPLEEEITEDDEVTQVAEDSNEEDLDQETSKGEKSQGEKSQGAGDKTEEEDQDQAESDDKTDTIFAPQSDEAAEKPETTSSFSFPLRAICGYGELIGLGVGYLFVEYHPISRIISVALFTAYYLCAPHAPNEHLTLAVLCAICAEEYVGPETMEYINAIVLGIAIHSIFAAGLAKCGPWLQTLTVRTHLLYFREMGSWRSRPLLPWVGRVVCYFRPLAWLVGATIVMMECFVIPIAAVQFDPDLRPLSTLFFIAYGVAWTLFGSMEVGLSMLFLAPSYIYAFACCEAALGTHPWLLAVGIAVFAPWWPRTFAWDGETAQALLDLLVLNDTRMVLATTRVAMGSLVGLEVVEAHDGKGVEGPVVHDCFRLTAGLDMVQGGEILTEAVYALPDDQGLLGSRTQALVNRTWAWLSLERRLVEVNTGEILTHVYLVRVDKKKITEVLM